MSGCKKLWRDLGNCKEREDKKKASFEDGAGGTCEEGKQKGHRVAKHILFSSRPTMKR